MSTTLSEYVRAARKASVALQDHFYTSEGVPPELVAEAAKVVIAESRGADCMTPLSLLKAVREEAAREQGVTQEYKIVQNSTLERIALYDPASLAELGRVPGVSPLLVKALGAELLAALRTARQSAETDEAA